MKTISEDDATENASALIRFVKKDLQRSPEQMQRLLGAPVHDYSPNAGFVWEFNGEFGTVSISATSGEVVTYIDSVDAGGADEQVSDAEAEQEMRRFLGRVYSGFENVNFQLAERERTPGCVRFMFQQARMPGEQSIFENFVEITVCGRKPRVASFDRSALSFVRTTPPRLSEDEARRIIHRLMGPGGRITAMDLSEQPFDHASKAVTVWAATVAYQVGGLESLDLILINADTGDRVTLGEQGARKD